MGKKANSHNFLETAQNINEMFRPGTTTECIAQWLFKKFRGGDKSLEDDECSGWPSDVDNNAQLASELNITYTMISNILRKLGGGEQKTKKT